MRVVTRRWGDGCYKSSSLSSVISEMKVMYRLLRLYITRISKIVWRNMESFTECHIQAGMRNVKRSLKVLKGVLCFVGVKRRPKPKGCHQPRGDEEVMRPRRGNKEPDRTCLTKLAHRSFCKEQQTQVTSCNQKNKMIKFQFLQK